MSKPIGNVNALYRQNSAYAKRLWALTDSKALLQSLRELTTTFGFSIALGDLTLVDGHWYVTHAGLLRLARRQGCRGIQTRPLPEFCDPGAHKWVFRAIVYSSRGSKGFVGYGDADPSNVSPLVRGAELRVAETRAVNRALRKAYGIGLCSVEEIGSSLSSTEDLRKEQVQEAPAASPSGNGQPRLRDRLCQLIRQHSLDPTLVKRYAADFCATQTLREAPREMVEAFINNLAEWATKDRPGLLCHLNSYADSKEAKP
ncbi:hypothetical protein MYX77_06475 [Acidobacteriia bacterium AH_259_A11_L15]|nr:hypothetical protein [Acidobacteriia bacterium AH_259_A11_L15]